MAASFRRSWTRYSVNRFCLPALQPPKTASLILLCIWEAVFTADGIQTPAVLCVWANCLISIPRFRVNLFEAPSFSSMPLFSVCVRAGLILPACPECISIPDPAQSAAPLTIRQTAYFLPASGPAHRLYATAFLWLPASVSVHRAILSC